MSVSDCKGRLGLPALLAKLGYGEPDGKGFLSSPFRSGESGDSFHVFQRDGLWFFKDHASGQGGDEVNFLKELMGLNDRGAIEKYHELAGVEWRKAGKHDPISKLGQMTKSEGGRGGKAEGLGKPFATYVYRDALGNHAFEVQKWLKDDGRKTFSQRRRALPGERSSNGWVWKVGEGDRILYRLPEVLACPASEPIFLVEGEKCVEAVMSLGLVATTMPCGAKAKGPVNWQPNYTASLAGKWVVLIGDNDEPGRKHVAAVAELLRPVVARLGIIDMAKEWPGCPDKGDVADWVEAMEKNNAGRLLSPAERN